MTWRELWDGGGGGGGGGGGKDVNSIRKTSFFVYCSLLGVFCTKSIIRKNKIDWSRTEEASNKTVAKKSLRYLFANPDRYTGFAKTWL